MRCYNKRYLVCVGILACMVGACERDSLERVCASLYPGELAFSEVRGPQRGPDTYGQWVEIYNPCDNDISLYGIILVVGDLRQEDFSRVHKILVRDVDLLIKSHDYAVLGRFLTNDLPSYADYGYESDYKSNLYIDGFLELRGCASVIDRVQYYDLPQKGTLAFDGSFVPDAVRNDDPSNWCVDNTEYEEPDSNWVTDVGLRGTPQERNRVCK